jgi:hypothetical protein
MGNWGGSGCRAGDGPSRGVQCAPSTGRDWLPDSSHPSAEDSVVEAGEPPAQRSPAAGRSLLPDGGQQSAEDNVAKTDELPTRSSPASDRSRLPDGSQTAIYVPYLDRGLITR